MSVKGDLKAVSYTVDVDLPDRGIRVSSFTVRYMPVDDSGQPFGVFDHVYFGSANPDVIVIQLSANETRYDFQGYIDSSRVIVDPVYVVEFTGRDKFAVLLEKKPQRELKYMSGSSCHSILSDIIYQAGLVPYFSFPDYVVQQDIVVTPQDSFASVIQRLIAPFQLGRLVNLDVYTEGDQVFIVKRNIDSPARGTVDITMDDIISIEFVVKGPEPQNVRLEGARVPQLKPIETDEWEKRYQKSVENTTDRRLAERRVSAPSAVEIQTETEDVENDDGSAHVFTLYQINKDRNGRVFFESILKETQVHVREGRQVNPPFTLPPWLVDKTSRPWSSREDTFTITDYYGETDRKKNQYEYRTFVFESSVIARETRYQYWEYDNCGDVSYELEVVSIDRYDDEGNYRAPAEKNTTQIWYYNEGAYKVRRVIENKIVGGSLSTRSFVERSPVRDERLMDCSQNVQTGRVEERRENEVTEERRGGRRVTDETTKTRRVTTNELDNRSRIEDETETRHVDSMSGNGYARTEEMIQSVRKEARSEEVSSRRSSYSFSERFEKKDVAGETVIESTREERRVVEETEDSNGKRVRQSQGETITRTERPRRENEVSLPEPPPGYQWVEEPVAVCAESEEANVIYNVSPMADSDLMTQLCNELRQEFEKHFVDATVRIRPNFNIKPGVVMRVIDAPSFWPVNRFYIVGMTIDGQADGIDMRLRGYAWY